MRRTVRVGSVVRTYYGRVGRVVRVYRLPSGFVGVHLDPPEPKGVRIAITRPKSPKTWDAVRKGRADYVVEVLR